MTRMYLAVVPFALCSPVQQTSLLLSLATPTLPPPLYLRFRPPPMRFRFLPRATRYPADPSMPHTCEEDGAVNGLLMAFVLRSSSLFMSDCFLLCPAHPQSRVRRASVTDAALQHVEGLSSLTLLDLVGCRHVTSAGMVHVGKLVHLEGLHLGSTGVQDDGLQHLLSLTRLKILAVPPGVTDAGMAQVSQLTTLELLDLWDSTVTQGGVGKLMSLPHLMRIRSNVSALDLLITR
ncbi:unnamed protein product [Closterium sp. NIES-54]